MKEYERLTKRNRRGFVDFKNCNEQDCIEDCGCCKHQHEINNRLAELEDDLESGKMIRLPCTIGDTVYVIDEMENSCGEIVCREVESCIVKQISIFDSFVCFGLVYTDGIIRISPIEEIYTTKAEAEAKLKELKE